MIMSTTLSKERITLRTTKTIKELLLQAASLGGENLTSFVLASAIEKARRVVKDHTSINLRAQGQLNLTQALKNHSKPTSAMKELMALPPFEKVELS